jgi:hypothetical protein
MAGSYQEHPLPWTRWTTWVLIAFVLAACTSLALFVHPYYEATDTTNDASMYIACAKALLAGEGYQYLGTPFTIRPPGFALLIVPVLALRGLDFMALNAFVGLFGVATVALLFVWLRPRVGTVVSLAVATVVWLNPSFRQMCNQVMSDVPGAASMLACLIVERWAERKPSIRRDLILGAAIGLASYVRSVNVLLVPAILCGRVAAQLFEHRWGGGGSGWLAFVRSRALGLAIATALVVAPWSIRDSLSRPEPPVDQNFLYSYSTAMWHVDGGDPSSPRRPLSAIFERVPQRARQITSMLGSRMTTSEGSTAEIAIGAVMLAAIVVALVRRRKSAEFMALGVTVVLAVYFGFQGRLVLPVWLFALAALADCVMGAITRAVNALAARAAVVVALAALVWVDWAPYRGVDRIEAIHAAYMRTCDAFRQRLAPDARVAAPIGWHYSVYLDRPVYSLFFAVRREGEMRAVERVIDEYGINTVVLWSAIPADQSMLPYFRERYGDDNAFPGGSVFRVRP